MLIVDKDGQVGFKCDICGKPIEFADESTRFPGDVSAWSLVVWREGEQPKIVHGTCAAYGCAFSHSELLIDVIIHWIEKLPKGIKLIHRGKGQSASSWQTYTWKGLPRGLVKERKGG